MIAILICVCTQVEAQDKEQRLHISYLGEYLTHPGFSLGYSHSLHTETKEKTKANGKEKSKDRTVFLLHSFSAYNQPRLSSGMMLTTSLGYRKTRAKGFFLQYGVGAGVFRSVLAGTTYEVDDNGEIEEKSFAGRTSFVNTWSMGFGKDFSKSGDLPIAIHWSSSLWFRYPYNNFVLPHFAGELGLSYKF